MIQNRSIIRLVCTLYFLIFTEVSDSQPILKSWILCDDYTEKVTLITDRDLYITGENIWYSAWLHCESDSLCNCLSRIMYMDIYKDLNGYSIRQKLHIENGKVEGSVSIPYDFPTGHYYIRVYTKYQKNYLAEDLAYHEILILNPQIPLNVPTNEEPLELFFKGGSAIYGLPAKAVLQVNIQEKSIISAEVITGTDEVVSPVNLINYKMGFFKLTPQPEQKYFIKICFTGNDSLIFPIRNICDSGWNLDTRRDDDSIRIALTEMNTPALQQGTLIIYDQFMRTIYSEGIQLHGNTWQKNIPANLFKTVTNYVGIKDSNNELLTFTVIYNPFDKIIPLEVETNKQIYNPFEMVEVTVGQTSGKSVEHIDLVISAVIKGSVRDSGIYSEPDLYSEAGAILRENSIRQNDDSFLRIFNENNTVNIRSLPEIRDVNLTGVVLDAGSGVPVSHCKVYLSLLGTEPQLHIYESREDGSFIFNLNNLEGNRKLYVGIDYRKHSNTEILINKEFIQEYIPLVGILAFSAEQHALYEELFVNMQVAKEFGSHRKISYHTQFQSQPFFTKPDISVVLSDFIEFSTMQEVFTEIVPFTFLKHKRDSFYFQILNPDTDLLIDNPLVLLDNIPVFNVNEILKLSPASIEKIDIIHQDYFLGTHRIEGLIHIISKESQLEQIEFPGGTVFFDYQAVNPTAEFKLPDSQVIKDSQGSIPYFNNLLYWKANLVLGNSPVKLEFFTGNNEAEYQIIVRGVTSDGIPCYGEKIIRAKRD